MRAYKWITVLLAICSATILYATTDSKRYILQGTVTDAAHNQPLSYATVQLSAGRTYLAGQLTDAQGHYHFSSIAQGCYRLKVSYVGYQSVDTLVCLKGNQQLRIRLASTAQSISEVVITASEKKGLTSTSVIDQTAMQHLQPSSFADLLSLLPGGMTSTPRNNQTNSIRLREVGISDDNYSVSSLGTKFLVDGAPIGTDANMQAITEGTQADNKRSHTATGVDMRNISTDDIESVEITRGIPSVKYGDLTSGLVSIRRKRTATPWEARFKADAYGKLLSIGKGFDLQHGWQLNTNAGWMTSQADPRNKFETYNRLNLSARLGKYWTLPSASVLSWHLSTDYAGNIDNVKTDPEVQIHLEDKYKSYYHNGAVSTSLQLRPKEGGWLHSLMLSWAGSLSVDKIDQTKFVSVDRTTHAPLQEENGEYDATYLPSTYVARYQVKGLPFYSNLRAEAELHYTTRPINHTVTAGTEWQYNKNFGQGQVYDPQRPLDGSTTHRPRAFKDIPATSILSFYAEDKASATLNGHQLTAMLGVRTTQMTNLGKQFAMHGKVYADPRFNFQWDLPTVHGLQLYLSCGIGRMSKMPTILDLYPEKLYLDFTQLNYWNKNEAYRRVNIRTYTIDVNNYELKPAHNTKWEVRLGGIYKGHQFYATYFHEQMNDGFKNSQRIIPMLTYKRYDTSGIDGNTLTAPPSLSDLPYRVDTLLRTYQGLSNDTRIIKQGIEWQYASPRIHGLNTRFTFNGAWFHTTYTNSSAEFYAGSHQQVNGITVNNRYIGLYEWKNGYIKEQISSNLIADTYFERIGLIFSVTAECYWWGKTLTPSRKPQPIAYADVYGQLHPYTSADQTDIYRSWLILTGQQDNGDTRRDRAYVCFNFKATKRFGRNATLSFFADRLLSIAPDYEVNGFIVRRVFTPYFGMEININI